MPMRWQTWCAPRLEMAYQDEPDARAHGAGCNVVCRASRQPLELPDFSACCS